MSAATSEAVPFTAPADLNKPSEPAAPQASAPDAAETAEEAPMPEINLTLSQQVVELENTRNILFNTIRVLKEGTFQGSFAPQVVQGVNLLSIFHRETDMNLKRLKKQLAQEVHAEKKAK